MFDSKNCENRDRAVETVEVVSEAIRVTVRVRVIGVHGFLSHKFERKSDPWP